MFHSAEEIRKQIIDLTAQYHAVKFEQKDFSPGQTPIRYAGRVFDEKSYDHLSIRGRI